MVMNIVEIYGLLNVQQHTVDQTLTFCDVVKNLS